MIRSGLRSGCRATISFDNNINDMEFAEVEFDLPPIGDRPQLAREQQRRLGSQAGGRSQKSRNSQKFGASSRRAMSAPSSTGSRSHRSLKSAPRSRVASSSKASSATKKRRGKSIGKSKQRPQVVDAEFLADTRALVSSVLSGSGFNNDNDQCNTNSDLDSREMAWDVRSDAGLDSVQALEKLKWQPSHSSQISGNVANVGRAADDSKRGHGPKTGDFGPASGNSLADLRSRALSESQVPRFYRQRVERQPLPKRMDGNLKPIGYKVVEDYHPASTVALYSALARFPRRHGSNFVEDFTKSLREPTVAAMLSDEMIVRQSVALDEEMQRSMRGVDAAIVLETGVLSDAERREAEEEETLLRKGDATSAIEDPEGLRKRQAAAFAAQLQRRRGVEKDARDKLWRNRLSSHLAQPMSAAIFASNQKPLGLPGTALAFDPVQSSNSFEGFAYSQLAHDAASLVQRRYRQIRRRRWNSARKLQAAARGLVARSNFRRTKAALLGPLSAIHRIVRGKLGRMEAARRRRLRMERRAVTIQAAFRYHREKLLMYRRKMAIARRAALRLQAIYRGSKFRRVVLLQQQEAAASALQRVFRGHSTRRSRFLRDSALGRSADHLLCAFRGRVAKIHVRVRRFAMRCRKAILIQTAFRRHAAQNQRVRRDWAVSIVQRYCWRHVGRLRFERQRQRLENEALGPQITAALVEAREFIATKEGKELVKHHRKIIQDRRKAEKTIMKAIPDKDARKRMERSINEREAFEMFDQDGSGQIDAQEFKKVVEELGVALGPDDRALAFRTLDKDGSGAVDFEEFAAWYGHLTETEGEKVLSPALGLLKLALGATRAIKRLLGIDLNLLSQRAAAMAHAAEQVSALRKAWRDWPPHTRANKPRFGKYHPPFVCETSLEGFVSQWLLDRHLARQPPVVPSDVMTLGQPGRRRRGAVRAAQLNTIDSGRAKQKHK